MEQPMAGQAALPTEKLVSDSPPNIVSPGMNADPDFPKVKSTILKKWIASTQLPKLEPADDSSMMTPDSILSDSAHSETKSPPPTVQLSVDTTYTTPLKESTSYYQCRACDSKHKMNESYPDKRPPIDESEDPHWICCDHCLNWYHCECVYLEPYESFLIDVFYCMACRPEKGPSKLKLCVAPHRNKFDAVDEVDKPIEVGTKPWIDEFIKDEATKYGPPPSSLVTVIEVGHDFEGQFDRNVEWKNVYLIKQKAGLGIQMPEPGEMYIDQLVEILGAKRLVETIDVYRQASVLMSVGRYRELLSRADRPRLFNILSLEFTGTKLADLVRPPSIVRELSWAERYWPDRKFGPPDTLPSGAEEACDTIHNGMRPDVELFCLMGMGGSFTDFHIDFGGSSVWYHVYKGQKIFYIVEPTSENLDIYQKHQLRPDREVFLGDVYGDKCWRVVIDEGQTLMIPAGWIHAVYTPVDSLVFGGNFLTNLNVDLQCEVNSHELRCLFESRYLYPNFETINWYAARSFTEMMREFNDDQSLPPIHLIRGAKALMETLNDWIERDKKSVDKTTQQGPARPFIHGESQMSILKVLTQEYKQMEKRFGSVAAELKGQRMSRLIKMESEEGEEEEREGPRVRISINVPEVHGSDSIRLLKLKIPRKSDIEKEKDSALNTPMTPKLRIRLGDATSALPSVVSEEEKRSIGDVDVVSMFSSRSKSGRQKKPAAWLKEQFGDEIDREMERDEYEWRDETRASTTTSMATDDVDYEALERAESGGVKRAEKRKKAPSTGPAAKERKKAPALTTSKQRLAEKMKNLKRH
ncbi:hypothetical protein PENTCL1PPCAC_18654 [Pristionchus entomophagus]|uniref:JmjC domain-containing protein n=1 Tax=Pristionchus entomophagus TaxID=358040 RepID=A0AAV5TQ00_9BILA|nr:hypothetical protein PENTCL1PPCAC_18654 [Pristionchus entomophagus]